MGAQAWHQAQYGRSQITMLYDETNAFGCLSAEDHNAAVRRLFRPEEAAYERDFHTQQFVSIGTMEGYAEVKVGEGTLMGSSTAPAKFVNAYDYRLMAWERDLLRHDRMFLETTSVHPVTLRQAQLGITTFVDDIARAFVFKHNEVERMAEMVNDGTERLAQHLGSGGISLNRGTTQVILTLRGVGAHGAVPSFCRRPLIEGIVDKEGRYLGPIGDMSQCPTTEVRARAAAGRRGWRILGSAWFEPLGHRAHRTLFLAFVQGALLSGMTSFVMTESAERRLDRVSGSPPSSSVSRRCLRQGGRGVLCEVERVGAEEVEDMPRRCRAPRTTSEDVSAVGASSCRS